MSILFESWKQKKRFRIDIHLQRGGLFCGIGESQACFMLSREVESSIMDGIESGVFRLASPKGDHCMCFEASGSHIWACPPNALFTTQFSMIVLSSRLIADRPRVYKQTPPIRQ